MLKSPRKTAHKLEGFIRRFVKGAKARGVAVGVSGGVDSAVVLALCSRALGRGRVHALVMPSKDSTSRQSLRDARLLARRFAGRIKEIEISPLIKAFKSRAGVKGGRVAAGNIKARIRMAMLYYHANSLGLLVAGTGDKSELLLKYFTKYGDGGVDFLPIGGLYKTEVRQLAKHLGLPQSVWTRPSSPELWKGHKAELELGIDYSVADRILHALFDKRMSASRAARELGLPLGLVRKVAARCAKDQHKLSMPPVLASR
jgi:NAD+ synthase